MRITHYDILGVQQNASQDEIKKAYKDLSLIWHPDKISAWADGAEQAQCVMVFKRISAAYECLSDATQRNQYNVKIILPITLDERKAEQEFDVIWKKLKAKYEAYNRRMQAPDLYMQYLQSRTANADELFEKLKRELDKYKRDLADFSIVFSNYQKQTEEKLAEAQGLVHSKQQEIQNLKGTITQKDETITELNKKIRGLQAQQAAQANELSKKNQEIQKLQAQQAEKTVASAMPDNNNVNPGRTSFSVFAARQEDAQVIDRQDSTKIIPKGLQAIYKMLDSTVAGKMEFYAVKLAFESEVAAKLFKQQWSDLFKDPMKECPFSVQIDYTNKDENKFIYKLHFMNCPSYFATLNNPERTGELLLAELEKYINTTNVRQEFRHAGQNAVIKEEELPAEFRRAELRM